MVGTIVAKAYPSPFPSEDRSVYIFGECSKKCSTFRTAGTTLQEIFFFGDNKNCGKTCPFLSQNFEGPGSSK